MQNILITGGTGLVGKTLTAMLIKKGYSVTILSRKPAKSEKENVSFAQWDVIRQTIDMNALLRADAIIHLAGAGVMDHKWDAAYKKEIIDSRVEGMRLITTNLARIDHKVKVLVSSSATGWYGPDRKGKSFDETDPAYDDYLGNVCKLWEYAAEEASALNIRVCKMRTGIVLSNDGGAFPEFKKPLKFGVAGILGGGQQTISWIHIDDLCSAYIYALENEMMSGSYNAVAEFPVTNKDLILKTAEQFKGKYFIPLHIPAFILKAMLGERSIEILKSVTVSNEKLRAAGFKFQYRTADAAIKALYEDAS